MSIDANVYNFLLCFPFYKVVSNRLRHENVWDLFMVKTVQNIW